jgi:hypothetical protein
MNENEWLKIFRHKPILKALAPYLSIGDWFALTATCAYMYGKWVTSDTIDALNMRKLVYDRFGWTYKSKNPFHYVRMYMSDARLPFGMKPKNFRCTGGCGKVVGCTHLMSSRLTKYAICDSCFAGAFKPKKYGIIDALNANYVPYKQATAAHWVSVTNELSFGTGGDAYDEANRFLYGQNDFLTKRITIRHYDWQKPDTPSFNAREYGFGPHVIARSDIKKRALEDIDTFQLRYKFAKWEG